FHDFGVERSNLPSRTRRPKIFREAFAAPGEFDEQHRFLQGIAHDASEPQLRPDIPFLDPEARPQSPAAAQTPDPHILPNHPLTVPGDQMLELAGDSRVLDEVLQAAPAAVPF